MGATVFNADGPDFDIMVWGWDSALYDPSYLLGIATTDQIGGNNDTYWTDPRYDELYAQQSTTIDRAARVKLVQEMQALHYAACPYIVMWYQKKLTGTRTNTWTGWKEITRRHDPQLPPGQLSRRDAGLRSRPHLHAALPRTEIRLPRADAARGARLRTS